MASSLCVLLSLVLAVTTAAPVPSDDGETTTVASAVPIFEVIEVIDTVPVLVPLVLDTQTETTTEVATKAPEHKLEKRSLRGDNPSNDLLTDIETQQYENGLSSLAGRRIKFLPTFLG